VNKLNVLEEKNMLKLLIKLSVPAMTGMFVMALYNIVDTIFVGHGVGPLGIAGLTIIFPFQMIIMSIGIAFGVGTASIISRNLGAKNIEKANKVMGTSFLASFIMSIMLMISTYFFIHPLLIIFGASKDIVPFSYNYLKIILLGTPFIIFSMIGNNIIRSEGRAKVAMFSMIIGALINIILDPIFIFIFKMGVSGAALASVCAQIIQFLFILCFFYSGKSVLHFHIKSFVIDFKILWEIISVGSSSFARMIAGSLVFILINNSISTYGDDISLAIFGISTRFIRFILMPIFGIAQGFQPIAGYNYGARKIDKIIDVTKIAIISTTLIISLTVLLTELFPSTILQLFSNDHRLIFAGSNALRIMVVALPLVGFQVIGSTLFQALGKAKPALILTMSRQILLLIPLILILPRYFGITGIWIAGPIADILSAIITYFFYNSLMKKLKIII